MEINYSFKILYSIAGSLYKVLRRRRRKYLSFMLINNFGGFFLGLAGFAMLDCRVILLLWWRV